MSPVQTSSSTSVLVNSGTVHWRTRIYNKQVSLYWPSYVAQTLLSNWHGLQLWVVRFGLGNRKLPVLAQASCTCKLSFASGQEGAEQTGSTAQQYCSWMEPSLGLCFLLVYLTCSLHTVLMIGWGCGWAGERQAPVSTFFYPRARASEGTSRKSDAPSQFSKLQHSGTYVQLFQALHFQFPTLAPTVL